jgi:ATP-dependent exoDNAse (exonuclease V) beta subunit
MTEWLELVDRLPPAEVLDRVIADAAYLYELRGARSVQARENLKKMRGLVRRIQNRGYATLARIADYADQLSAGDESNAIIDALDAVNLMTVHAAKGLEFPIVFVVSLTRGTGGAGQPIRVVADTGEGRPSVSVGAFRNDADEEERISDKEETKRLLYVALTRARDRLYLSTVTRDGEARPGRGSLAEVLPESICRMLAASARCDRGTPPIVWTSASGRSHVFASCRAATSPDLAGRDRPEAQRAAPGSPDTARDDFGPLAASPGPLRLRAAECGAPVQDTEPLEAVDDSATAGDPQVGVLVHRLFQFCPSRPETREELRARAAGLVEASDVGIDGAGLDRIRERATHLYEDLRSRPAVAEALETGRPMFEVPFSVALSAGASLGPYAASGDTVIRGNIDWLVRRADGSVLVLELKTGAPRASHQAQLQVYVAAVRQLFPLHHVDGILLYA